MPPRQERRQQLPIDSKSYLLGWSKGKLSQDDAILEHPFCLIRDQAKMDRHPDQYQYPYPSEEYDSNPVTAFSIQAANARQQLPSNPSTPYVQYFGTQQSFPSIAYPQRDLMQQQQYAPTSLALDVQHLQGELFRARDHIAAINNDLWQKQREAAEAQGRGNELQNQNNTLLGQLQIDNTTIERQANQLVKFEGMVTESTEKEEKYRAEIKALKEELETEKAKDKKPRRQRVRKNSKELKQELEDMTKSKDELQETVASLKLEHLGAMERMIDRNDNRMSKLATRVSALRFLFALLRSHSTSLKRQHDSSKAELAELRASYEADQSENEQEKLHIAKEETENLQKTIDELEERIKLYEIVAQCAALIRIRTMHDGNKGGLNHWEAIEKGNRAAHDGDLRLDSALITLGFFGAEDVELCKGKYGCDVLQFVGSSATLQPLLDWPCRAKMYNLRAYIETEFKRGIKTDELRDFHRQFQELERGLRGYLSSLEWTDEEKGWDAFESDPSVSARIGEMELIVKEFQEGCNKALGGTGKRNGRPKEDRATNGPWRGSSLDK